MYKENIPKKKRERKIFFDDNMSCISNKSSYSLRPRDRSSISPLKKYSRNHVSPMPHKKRNLDKSNKKMS